jgi:hypothetical protein
VSKSGGECLSTVCEFNDKLNSRQALISADNFFMAHNDFNCRRMENKIKDKLKKAIQISV